MLFNLLIVGGLLFCAALMYTAVEKMLSCSERIIDRKPESSEEKHVIASEDIMFLHEAERFANLSSCLCYTGSRRELLSEINPRRVDMIILQESKEEQLMDEGMKCLYAQYYGSELSLAGIRMKLHPLSHRPRRIVIYYRPYFESMLADMIREGMIKEREEIDEVNDVSLFRTFQQR